MTNAEARFNNSLRPRKPEGSLGRTAQDGHLDSHTAPELCGLWAVSCDFVPHIKMALTGAHLNRGCSSYIYYAAGVYYILHVVNKPKTAECRLPLQLR